MNIKLASQEDLTITTKGNHVVTVPDKDGTLALGSEVEQKYTKPANGIPKEDLAQPLQDSLDAADAAKFRAWYPDGSVTSESQFTAGLRYRIGTGGGAIILPFCNTGTQDADNSDKTGDIVIPPYIVDDGTVYEVTDIDGYSGDISGDSDEITSVVAPTTVVSIGAKAFCRCTSLLSASFPSAVSVGVSAFFGSAVVSVYIPSAATIGSLAFSDCLSLETVDAKAVTTLGAIAFSGCWSLESIDMPLASSVPSEAFAGCSDLVSASFESAIAVGSLAFSGAASIESLRIPNVQTLSSEALRYCYALNGIEAPSATSIGSYSMASCTSLRSAYLPACTNVGAHAFYNDTALEYVDFGGTPRENLEVPTLGENAFVDVPTSCMIVVPDAQYDAWTTASGWSDLVTAGYVFIRHSDWEIVRRYEINRRLVSPDGKSTAAVTDAGTVTVTKEGAYDGPVEDWEDLKEAVELEDATTPGEIREALGLPSTATLADAVAAAGDLSFTMILLTQNALAAPFSETATYSKGTYITRAGKMYECTSAHSGSWNSGHFHLTSVGDIFEDIVSALNSVINEN